jgi:HAD superfamily hydrolase (TIGR01509 family)
MRTYHGNLFALLFMLILISTVTIAARRSSNKKRISLTKNISTPSAEKPIIVFDLINVLFKENYAGFAQKIGYGTLASYAVTHWKNPGHRCLDMLEEMSKTELQTPHLSISLQGRTMPRCIVELHEGKKTCSQAKNEIISAIEELNKENFFTSIKEKNLMTSIMELTLDPETIAHITEPIKPMIMLMQKLKRNEHTLYLLANVPDEFYNALQNKYPSILSLFDGIVISSQIKTAKPDKPMFEHLLTTHNLNPEKCILIDNFKENVSMAQSLGMRSILYEKPSTLTQYLKGQGVIFS